MVKKVLILGIGQSNFLDQLYGGINKRCKEFAFYIDNYNTFSKENVDKTLLPYTEFYNFSENSFSYWKIFKSLSSFIFKGIFWDIVSFEYQRGKKLKQIKDELFKFTLAKCIVDRYIIPNNYDIIHFHFCTPNNLREVFFLPNKCKIICSFWGSDLLRDYSPENKFYVKKALEYSTNITLQSEEMGEILLEKYGYEFRDKLRYLRFTLDPRIFEFIDHFKNEKLVLDKFKSKHDIPKDRIVVTIGHNAYSENNHLEIIKEIRKLSKTVLSNYVFVLHLSYGGNSEYIEKLIEVAESESEVLIIPITSYLNPEESAKLRLCTNLFIQMPITDALSGTMTEVLYAGNSVVAGSWLPYNILKRNDIFFSEIKEFKYLPEFLETFIDESGFYRHKNKLNKKNIQLFLFPDRTTEDWIKLLKILTG